MANLFSVKFNTKPLDQFRQQLGPKMDQACARALNRTVATEKVTLSRAISGDMGISVTAAKDAIKVEQATPANQSARLVARGARLPLIEFKAKGPEPSRGRGRGVSYKLPGSAGRIASAFIVTLRSGHRGVFVRAGDSRRHGPKPNRSQLPIRELFGPSIVKVFEKMVPVGAAKRTEVLLANLKHEIEYQLSKVA